jgi:hypothetical protein
MEPFKNQEREGFPFRAAFIAFKAQIKVLLLSSLSLRSCQYRTMIVKSQSFFVFDRQVARSPSVLHHIISRSDHR